MQLPRKDCFVGQSVPKLIPRGGHKPQGFSNDNLDKAYCSAEGPDVVQGVPVRFLNEKVYGELLGQGWKCLGLARKEERACLSFKF